MNFSELEALGPKSTIAPSTPDDEKVDTSNRKKGALYMVSDVSHNPLFNLFCVNIGMWNTILSMLCHFWF